VAVAVVLASVVVYALVRDSLRDQIDDDLRERASRATTRIGGEGPPGLPPGVDEAPAPPPGEAVALPPPGGPGGPPALGQVIEADGTVVPAPGPSEEFEIPVSAPAQDLAAGGGDARFEDVDVEGTPLRVLTQPLPEGGALQVGRSLEQTEDTLSTLVVILFLVSAGGIALAAALGPVVARTALAPAGEVSSAAEEVARTRDLTRRIEVHGSDELGRLAASFNQMMEALERSEASQRRLVADASHELRTPLATLRTNIETLGRADEISPAERERVVSDLTDELEEMTELVADVVELARQPGPDQLARDDVRLDELAGEALERARRRARGLSFSANLTPSVVSGDSQRLGRAISNLLDNAAKWSPSGGEVVVEVSGGRVRVRDHGPGFAAEDLPKVFDRFWRSDEARGKQGSGLGLAIVQRVAEEHGGRASAANAEDGGAIVGFDLPGAETPEPANSQAPS
jgi:two-component system sensor histidine kinase MprB